LLSAVINPAIPKFQLNDNKKLITHLPSPLSTPSHISQPPSPFSPPTPLRTRMTSPVTTISHVNESSTNTITSTTIPPLTTLDPTNIPPPNIPHLPPSSNLPSHIIPPCTKPLSSSPTTQSPKVSIPKLHHLETKLSRYYGTYPTSAQLTLAPFGRPSTQHSFMSEATFDHILIHLIKSSFLTQWEQQHLNLVHPLYQHLHTSIHRFRYVDFRPLSDINLSYANQTTIPHSRLLRFQAAILHYNFRIPSLIRFCGNNYVNSHLNPKAIRARLTGIVPSHIVDYVFRALSTGAPTKINAYSTSQNFWDYLRYGNHASITSRPDLVQKSLVKEEKYNYVLPFPGWMARFVPNLHVSPEGIIVKEGKKDRIIYDASFHVHPLSFCPNDWTSVHDEPPIYYGSALYRHLSWIWNLRISYPAHVIYLWDDDVSGAFRIVKYNPEVASAFSAMVNQKLWIPVGQVFGGNTSAQNFEGIARARECLSSYMSCQKFSHLIEKHNLLLQKIKYYSPPSNLNLCPAHPDSKNLGVFDTHGLRKSTPHNTFVDDNHVAEIRSRIVLAQAASVEGLYQILDFPKLHLRRDSLSNDKYLREQCGPIKLQLGYLINTNEMIVTFSDQRFNDVLTLLSNWHSRRQVYTLKEAAKLAGILEFISSMTPWLRFLTVSIKHSILLALRKNFSSTLRNTQHIEAVSDSKLLGTEFESLRKKNFAVSFLLRTAWNSKRKFKISLSLRRELEFLIYLFKNRKKLGFASPIAHLIDKDPDFHVIGDACLEGAGGFSPDLHFWWYIRWPHWVRQKTLKFFVKTFKTLDGSFLSINLLEYTTIILSYAASIEAINLSSLSPPPHPTLHIASDNTAAVAWSRRAASSTTSGKSLSIILSHLMMRFQHIGLHSTFIPGKLNIIADALSRMYNQSNSHLHISSLFNPLAQEHPLLKRCRRFHLHPELLSLIWVALSSNKAPPVPTTTKLGHFVPENFSG